MSSGTKICVVCRLHSQGDQEDGEREGMVRLEGAAPSSLFLYGVEEGHKAQFDHV
jgi:hypothetical protein